MFKNPSCLITLMAKYCLPGRLGLRMLALNYSSREGRVWLFSNGLSVFCFRTDHSFLGQKIFSSALLDSIITVLWKWRWKWSD